MVEYICNTCGKNFGNRKSSYIDHTEHKKNPCKPQQKETSKKPEITSKIELIPQNVTHDNSIMNINICKYCNKMLSRYDNLKRHIVTCKVKKLKEEEKENIFKELLNKEQMKNNELQQRNNVIERLEKENRECKRKITELEKQMSLIITKNVSKNVSKNNCHNKTQNIQINNINIVDHGKEDFDKINYKVFTDAMLKTGPLLFEKLTKGIHFNPDYPENQNIYISDINREKVMIYNNKRWILENYDNLYPNFISRILEFGYTKEKFMDECFENGKLNQTGIDIIKNKMQWIRLIDDYTEEEIDEDIKMKEFREKHDKKEIEKRVKNQIKKTMYNNKDMVIENYDKLYNENIKKELLTNE